MAEEKKKVYFTKLLIQWKRRNCYQQSRNGEKCLKEGKQGLIYKEMSLEGTLFKIGARENFCNTGGQ